jgi:hypothetical protein
MPPTAPAAFARQKFNRVPRPLLRLEDHSDNEAQAGWRDGKAHRETYSLPRGFDPWERAGDNYRLQSIAKTTETHLSPNHVRNHADMIEIRIWGNPSQCAAARIAINAWVSEHNHERTVARAKKSFTKANNFNNEKYQAALKKIDEEARRQKYRQNRTLLLNNIKHIVVIKWVEVDWTLDSFLGPQLEALDTVRMKFRSYIEYVRDPKLVSQAPCFVVSGNHKKLLHQAVDRVIGVNHQVLSRQIERYQFFLVKPIRETLSAQDRIHSVVRRDPYARPPFLTENTGSISPEKCMVVSLEKRDGAVNPSQDLKFMSPIVRRALISRLSSVVAQICSSKDTVQAAVPAKLNFSARSSKSKFATKEQSTESRSEVAEFPPQPPFSNFRDSKYIDVGERLRLSSKLQTTQAMSPAEKQACEEQKVSSIAELPKGLTRIGAQHALQVNGQYLNLFLIPALESLTHYNGYLRMRVALGTCILTSYRRNNDEAYHLGVFEDMLQGGNKQEEPIEASFSSE